MTLDISAAERDLKYKPKISMEEGLRRFLEWFATQPQSKL